MNDAANAHLPSCSVCGAPRATNTNFCAACGAQQRVRREPATFRIEPKETRAAVAEGRQHLKSALGLWITLLSITTVSSLLAIQLHWVSLWYEVWMSLIFAVTVLIFCWPHRVALKPLFTTRPITTRNAWCVPVAGATCALFFWLYFSGLERVGIEARRLSDDYMLAGWPTWSMFLLVSFAPGFTEELGFRGLIQTQLERVMRAKDAWLVQAAMFSVLHLSPVIFISHFVMGLAFGWVRLRTGSIYPSMLLHMLWNAGVLCLELRDLEA